MYAQQVSFCQAVSCLLLHFEMLLSSEDHTRLTHQYLLHREEPPQSPSYNCALTVVHIIRECRQLNSIRQKYFSITTLKELFDTVISDDSFFFERYSFFFHIVA